MQFSRLASRWRHSTEKSGGYPHFLPEWESGRVVGKTDPPAAFVFLVVWISKMHVDVPTLPA